MYIRTRGRAFVHGRPVSVQHFANLLFTVMFYLSTAPPLAGGYAQCVLRSMPRYVLAWCMASFTKCEPLSLEILFGIPHLGIISDVFEVCSQILG